MRKIENMMLTVFLVVSLICGKFLLDYWQDSYDNRQNYRQVEEIAFPEKDTQEEETEPNEDNSTTEIDDFDYQSLLDENADCIGWLKISDTDISYPVVQGKDNEFYLHHDFQKNYAICGTLMLDCRNDIDARQEHLIIYGHQMKDGSMFKQLNGYKKEAFYHEHKEITLYCKRQVLSSIFWHLNSSKFWHPVTLQYFCDTAGCAHIVRKYVLLQMREVFPVMTKIFFPDLIYDSVKCFQ